jgi:hypothetical protein
MIYKTTHVFVLWWKHDQPTVSQAWHDNFCNERIAAIHYDLLTTLHGKVEYTVRELTEAETQFH